MYWGEKQDEILHLAKISVKNVVRKSAKYWRKELYIPSFYKSNTEWAKSVRINIFETGN